MVSPLCICTSQCCFAISRWRWPMALRTPTGRSQRCSRVSYSGGLLHQSAGGVTLAPIPLMIHRQPSPSTKATSRAAGSFSLVFRSARFSV